MSGQNPILMRKRSGTYMRGTVIAMLAITSLVPPADAADRVNHVTSVMPDREARVIEMYCSNMRDKVLDARYQWQTRLLSELDGKVSEQIAQLDKRIAEYRKWYELRQEFSARARAVLIKVMSTMRPDAAAAQLGAMDEMTASAIILKLDTRQSSKILNEMKPEKAARIASIIADAAGRERKGDGS